MISIIIPSYRSPQYLDICLKSAINGQENKNEIIVIIDGFVEESKHIISKYKVDVNFISLEENSGMQHALNLGVYNAKNQKILIINDDNVLPDKWDVILENEYESNTVITINQIEPHGPGIFNFHTYNFGEDAQTFKFDEFIKYEKIIRNNTHSVSGRIFPFMINKKHYMTVNGFDTFYDSPFICDWDFFLKLEMLGKLNFYRTYKMHIYHFGSKATKNHKDKNESDKFRSGEHDAYKLFQYKW